MILNTLIFTGGFLVGVVFLAVAQTWEDAGGTD